jgi:hypothetical protein
MLGTIAGVATGYALKKYLDEEESVSDDTHTSDTAPNISDYMGWFTSAFTTAATTQESNDHINLLEPLDTIKQKLNKTLFRKTESLMGAIENLCSNTPHITIEESNTIQTLENTPENEAEITGFCDILTRAEQVQHVLLDELIKPFFEIDDANELEGEEKIKATRFIEIDRLMREACATPITLDGTSVSAMAKMAFHKLAMCIDENNTLERNGASIKTILAISGRGLNFANYVKTLQNDDLVYPIEYRSEFEEILDHLRDKKVLIVVGLGRGKGTTRITEVTAVLTQEGIDFTVYATLPFDFEGESRRNIAQSTLDQLIQNGYKVHVEDNDALLATIGMITAYSDKTFLDVDKKLYEKMEA